MDRELIEGKLESLRRCVKRIEAKCPASAGELAANLDLQDIVSLNLTRAVQICVDVAAHIVADSDESVPEIMSAVFDALVKLEIIQPELGRGMKSAVGFRNIAIHNYQSIDWEIVYAICRGHLEDFKSFAKATHKLLDNQQTTIRNY